MEDIMDEYIRKAYIKKFGYDNDFNENKSIYNKIKTFAPSGNVNEVTNEWNEKVHFIMRWTTGYRLKQALSAMKIDLSNSNVMEDMNNDNIGTAQRIAKVWTGSDNNDDMELGGGRWSKKPRIATFPNNSSQKFPITKKVDIISNCSHHFIPFTTLAKPESYAVISYIPDLFVLGISKLQRLADWISQRFWLQEDLTKTLYDEISEVAKTKSVYVKLFNMTHGCEVYRGAKSNDGSFTSEYYGGLFNNKELRNEI